MDNEQITEYSCIAKELTARAEDDRNVQIKRLLCAGASPLMIDALVDAARKEMWAVLFAHLVEVAVEWQRSEDNNGDEDMSDWNEGKHSGIADCIRNVYEYVQAVPAGSA